MPLKAPNIFRAKAPQMKILGTPQLKVTLSLQLWAGGLIDGLKYPKLPFDPSVNPNKLNDNKLERVSLSHITSALWFLAIGLGLSIVAFIWEVARNRPKPHKECS